MAKCCQLADLKLFGLPCFAHVVAVAKSAAHNACSSLAVSFEDIQGGACGVRAKR